MRRISVLVIGLGYFGQAVAETLTAMGHEVVSVDKDMDIVESLKEKLENLSVFDATDDRLLRRLGVEDFDACVVGTGTDLGSSILITATLKSLGARFVAAKAVTERQAEILKRIGADIIIFPEKEAGERLAHQLLLPGRILKFFELDPEWSLEEVKAPEWMEGKSLKELNLRREQGVTVIAILRDSKVMPNPSGDDVIKTNDLLLVFGRNVDLERLIRR